jgi:hypothetical protein
MHRQANKNSRNTTSNNQIEQVKIYFPSISIQVLQNALHSIPNPNKKQKQIQKQTQNKTELDKYLFSENQKTIIYGTNAILEIHNSHPYSIYPSDKLIVTSSIPMSSIHSKQAQQPQQPQIQLLVDYSSMKRSQTPSYQIPYEFKVHSYLEKKYKMNPKSDTTFVVQYKDDKIYDFYVLAKLPKVTPQQLTGLSTNRIEIDNFVKEDIISFLLMLNLY